MNHKPTGYVPPPPKGSLNTPKPPKPNVKSFPVSNGKAPWMMQLPGIQSDPKPEMPEG